MTPEMSDKPATSSAPAQGPGGYRPRPGGYAGGTGARPGMGAGRPGMGGPGAGGPRGMKPPPRRRVCRICMERQGGVDWKAANFLRNFITERGKILSGRSTGTCARCQRQLTEAIKRARNIALVPTSPL